jgi:hypothetical protein
VSKCSWPYLKPGRNGSFFFRSSLSAHLRRQVVYTSAQLSGGSMNSLRRAIRVHWQWTTSSSWTNTCRPTICTTYWVQHGAGVSLLPVLQLREYPNTFCFISDPRRLSLAVCDHFETTQMAYTGCHPATPVLDWLQLLSTISDQQSCHFLPTKYDGANKEHRVWVNWRIRPCFRRNCG